MATIVIVEDDPSIQQFLGDLLTDDGHTCWHACTAQAGLQRVLADPPDLLLVDVRLLGGMDGLTLVRHLRAMPTAPQPPIIVLSADLVERRALAGLGARFLPKPFTLDTLLRLVAAAVPSARPPRPG